MDPTTDTPVVLAAPRSEKKWAWPWYITTALLVGLCLVYCHYTYSAFWELPGKNIGRFAGYLLVPFIILLPIAAAIGAIVWLVVAKLQKPFRIAFSPFWVGSLAAIVALLFAGTQYRAAQEEKEWEQKIAASRVAADDLRNIELFDGTMSWAPSYGGQSDTIDKVHGRIRNGLGRALSSITVRIVIRNGDEKVIETFDFEVPGIGAYSATPLQPGHVRGFTYRTNVSRVPRDLKWNWGIIDARYVLD